MQVLDRTGVGTLWSICKTKFALKDHSHNYLPLSGGTLTGDLLFSNSGTTFRQIRGTCGDNDFWRIGGGATGSNAGYMEIATADDGTEPIYVRQYSGTFRTITRTVTLLDGNGNTSFPGTVAAAKFKGALEGNASTVNGYTVNANVPSNAKFTDTNTWRPIQDNLTSTSTSESLSANQGRILKGLVDGKANSSHTHSWSQISGAPATATRWPSWGEVTGKPGSFTPSSHTHDWSQITGKPDIKSWSETKSYIDNKVDSASNFVTLKEYLQKQLDQFGLKVGCGVVSDKIDQTCYQAFETGASETVNKYIYDTVNNIKLDTETNISTKLNDSSIYYDIVFDKYFYDSGEFYDNNFQLLKRIGTVGSYLIGPDFMYTRNFENRKLYIYDKNLNTKTVDIPTSFGYIDDLLKDLGDDGILIRNKVEGKYSSLIYKDGVFKESDITYTSTCYNINGHLYNKDSLGTILTKNVAIKSNKKYLCKNGCLHLQLFTIKDLYNNKDYNISIPIELYQFSDLDRTKRNKVFGLILSSYSYDKDAIYYIVIYRE